MESKILNIIINTKLVKRSYPNYNSLDNIELPKIYLKEIKDKCI